MAEDIPSESDESTQTDSAGKSSSDQQTGNGNVAMQGGSPPPPPGSPTPTPTPINLGVPQSVNSSTPPTKDAYNPEIVNDKTRTWIALALLGVTGAIVIVTFILTSYAISPVPQAAETNLKVILTVVNVIFGPIIALLGSVIGFYFGSRAASGNNTGK